VQQAISGPFTAELQGAPAPVQTIGGTAPLAATSQTIMPSAVAAAFAPSMPAPESDGGGFLAALMALRLSAS
jgi:hypothetical protein